MLTPVGARHESEIDIARCHLAKRLRENGRFGSSALRLPVPTNGEFAGATRQVPMIAVIQVVFPVFGIILSSDLCGRFRLLGEAGTDALNRFVTYVALPALFVISMARGAPPWNASRLDRLADR